MAGEVTLPEETIEGAAPTPEPAPPQTVNMIKPQPGMVAVKNADGDVVLVHEADAFKSFSQGARPASEADYLGATTGLAGKIASAGIAAGRGASFGLSDPLLIEGSRLIGGNAEAEDTRHALNLAKEVGGAWGTGGEIAGSLAGMYLLPGAGVARTALTGEGLLARAGTRALAALPRAALEGGAIGIGHQASEDALGNQDATAQKYVASAWHGAVFGGLLGAGLHAGGGAVADRLKGFYGRAAEAAEGAATREGESGGTLDWLRNKVTSTAEEKAFKATGARPRDYLKLGSTAEQQAERSQRIGRTLLDEGIVTGTASQQTMAQRLTAKVSQVGEELGAMRSKLDTAVARPSTEAIASRVMEEVLAPLERLPGTQAEAAAVRQYMSDFIEKAGPSPSFEKLHTFRRALDDKLNPKLYAKLPGTAPPAAQELGAVRNIIEDEFTSAGERAAQELGDTFASKYNLTKQLYGDLRTADKIITKAVGSVGNRAISLTDTIAGSVGLVAGGITGLAAGVANKAMRHYGDQAAADLLNRASKLEFLQRASQNVDDAIAGSVKGFLTGERGAAKGAAKEAPKVTDETVAQIREATRDPEALTTRVASVLENAGLRDAAPKTSQAIASTLMRAFTLLRDKAPKEPPPSGISFVAQPPRPMSHSELATYGEIVDAVNDPVSVVDDLRHGRISREQVEAIRVVYPELYQHIRTELADQAVQLRPTLSTQQEIALSVLFDVPVGELMKPDTIKSFQATFARPDPTQDPTAGVGGAPQPHPMQFDRERGSLASGFDKQEAGTS